MFWLAVLFFVVPLAELAVIVQVAGWLGVAETILALIVISFVGGWLVKREGMGVWRRLQRQLERGQLPRTEVVDGFLVMLAGALLLTPGFLTDLLAGLLLVPPSRAVSRRIVMAWWARRTQLGRTGRMIFTGGDVIDVDGDETTATPTPTPRPTPTATKTATAAGELGRP
jgi:UPF0716 protein FxsA